jgi:hypothetical protein
LHASLALEFAAIPEGRSSSQQYLPPRFNLHKAKEPFSSWRARKHPTLRRFSVVLPVRPSSSSSSPTDHKKVKNDVTGRRKPSYRQARSVLSLGRATKGWEDDGGGDDYDDDDAGEHQIRVIFDL